MSKKKVLLLMFSIIISMCVLGSCGASDISSSNAGSNVSDESVANGGKEIRLPSDSLKRIEELNSDKALMSKYKNIGATTTYYYSDHEEHFSYYLDSKMYKTLENDAETTVVFDYKAGYSLDEKNNNIEYIYYLGDSINELLERSPITDYRYLEAESIVKSEETSVGYLITTVINDEDEAWNLANKFQYDSKGIKRIKYAYELNKDYEILSYSQYISGDSDIKIMEHKMDYKAAEQNFDSEFKKYYQNGTSYTFVIDAETDYETKEVLTVTKNVPFSVMFPEEYNKGVYMDVDCTIPLRELDGSITTVYVETK